MRRKLAVFLSALALCCSLTACSKEQTEKDYSIHVICKSQDAYWNSVQNACTDAEKEMPIQVIYTAPETEDAEKQKELIQNAINDHADAIIFAPVVAEGYDDVLDKATESGIPLFAIDSETDYADVKSCLKTDNYAAGYLAGTEADKIIKNGDTIGIIAHSLDKENITAQERLTGFTDCLHGIEMDNPLMKKTEQETEAEEKSENYTKNELIIRDGEGDIQTSKHIAEELIKENPNLKVLYGTNQPSTIGICYAVDALVKSGEIEADTIQVIGFDFFSGAEQYIESGVLDGCVIQNPYNMGYLGIKYAVNLLQGDTIPSSLDTGSVLVTEKNLYDTDVQFIINPA